MVSLSKELTLSLSLIALVDGLISTATTIIAMVYLKLHLPIQSIASPMGNVPFRMMSIRRINTRESLEDRKEMIVKRMSRIVFTMKKY